MRAQASEPALADSQRAGQGPLRRDRASAPPLRADDEATQPSDTQTPHFSRIPMRKKTLSFDESSLIKLTSISSKKRIPMAEVVRRALRLYFAVEAHDVEALTVTVRTGERLENMRLLIP